MSLAESVTEEGSDSLASIRDTSQGRTFVDAPVPAPCLRFSGSGSTASRSIGRLQNNRIKLIIPAVPPQATTTNPDNSIQSPKNRRTAKAVARSSTAFGPLAEISNSNIQIQCQLNITTIAPRARNGP